MAAASRARRTRTSASCGGATLNDGDTWTDESTRQATISCDDGRAGGGQWFEDVLYLNSGGQGIMRKKMEG